MKETAYLGAGCFWGAELAFSKVNGVLETEVGFGDILISENQKSRVEVVKLVFDNKLISFSDLINVFWTTHDPTSDVNLNQNYIEKSVIFTLDDNQQKQAEENLKSKIESVNGRTIYTDIRNHISYKKAPEKDQKYYFTSSI